MDADAAVEAIIWPTIHKMADIGFIDRDESHGGIASYEVDLVGDLVHFVLDQLTSPRTVECDRCNAFGVVPVATSHFDDQIDEVTSEPCPSCSGSGRIEKGPIAYLASSLECVGWQWLSDDGPVGATIHPEAAGPSTLGKYVPLVRLPDESPKGGA